MNENPGRNPQVAEVLMSNRSKKRAASKMLPVPRQLRIASTESRKQPQTAL